MPNYTNNNTYAADVPAALQCSVETIGPGRAFARPLIRQKNLNPCHQMLFLGSKYAKIAFATPLGSLSAPTDPCTSRNIGAYF